MEGRTREIDRGEGTSLRLYFLRFRLFRRGEWIQALVLDMLVVMSNRLCFISPPPFVIDLFPVIRKSKRELVVVETDRDRGGLEPEYQSYIHIIHTHTHCHAPPCLPPL